MKFEVVVVVIGKESLEGCRRVFLLRLGRSLCIWFSWGFEGRMFWRELGGFEV